MKNSKREVLQVPQGLDWTTVMFMIGIHFAAVYALAYGVVQRGFSVRSWIAAVVFFLMSVMGISVGYHRFMTHKSFECVWPVKLLFLICAGLTLQRDAISWCTNHREHHNKTDREGDLHSPNDGGWWAHMGWLFVKGEKLDERALCPDLVADPLVASHKYWWFIPGILGFVIPFWLWGWDGLWLAGVLRFVFVLHAILAINSVCHTWGDRPFATKDRSTNNKLLAWLIPSGEPYHNNHHADPNCAYLGWRWYQPDFGKWFIQLGALIRIGKLRLIWGVKKPRPEFIRRVHEKRALINQEA